MWKGGGGRGKGGVLPAGPVVSDEMSDELWVVRYRAGGGRGRGRGSWCVLIVGRVCYVPVLATVATCG